MGGKQHKAQAERARDMHDPEVPRLDRELGQEGQVDAGIVGDRHPVQRQHVKRGINGCDGSHDHRQPSVEDALIAAYRLIIDA